MNKPKLKLKLKRLFGRAVFTLSTLLLSTSAFADGDDAVTAVISNICKWLSGTPAIGVGILAVIYSGYEMLHGDICKKTLIIRCVAMALIIGGAHIGQNIIMNGLN